MNFQIVWELSKMAKSDEVEKEELLPAEGVVIRRETVSFIQSVGLFYFIKLQWRAKVWKRIIFKSHSWTYSKQSFNLDKIWHENILFSELNYVIKPNFIRVE